jgi:hypothetical protein
LVKKTQAKEIEASNLPWESGLSRERVAFLKVANHQRVVSPVLRMVSTLQIMENHQNFPRAPVKEAIQEMADSVAAT